MDTNLSAMELAKLIIPSTKRESDLYACMFTFKRIITSWEEVIKYVLTMSLLFLAVLFWLIFLMPSYGWYSRIPLNSKGSSTRVRWLIKSPEIVWKGMSKNLRSSFFGNTWIMELLIRFPVKIRLKNKSLEVILVSCM